MSTRPNVKAPFHRTRSADRDEAMQAAAVAATIEQHEEALAPFLPIYGWADEFDSPPPGQIRLFNREVLVKRLAEARQSDARVMQSELSKALELGEYRRLAKTPTSQNLRLLHRDFPHFGEVIDVIRQRTSLAQVTPGQVLVLPPILLSGPPGVGKTAFAEAMAASLNQPMKRVDIASATASFVLAGSHESWSAARHGAIWSLLQAPTASGILLLDEIDKASGGKFPIVGPLYSLLEKVSACHFQDEYMLVPIDASHLTVIATCNDPDALEPALRSRFRLIHVRPPARQEMPAIAKSVYRQLRATRPWGSVFPVELPAAVIERVSGFTPRELSRLLEDALGRAASAGRLFLVADDINLGTASAKTKPKIGFVQ